MMTRALAIGVLIGFGAGMIPRGAEASVDTNRELTLSFVNYYLQNKEYESAQRFLADHLRADPRDSGAWNLLGLTFIRAEKLEQANQAFYRAVTQAELTDTQRPIYLYHYADALNRSGEIEKAQAALKQIEGDDRLASTVTEALRTISAKQPLPELSLASTTQFTGHVSLSSGYDTNVLMTSDTSAEALDASDIASPFILPAAQLGWEFDGLGGRMDAVTVGAFTYQLAESAQRFNSLYGSFTLGWRREQEEFTRWEWRFDNTFDLSLVNLDGTLGLFNLSDAVTAHALWNHGAKVRTDFSLGVGYASYPQADDALEDDDRSGLILRPSITHQRELGPGQLEAGVEYEQVFASGSNFVSSAFAFPITWRQPVFGFWQGKLLFEPTLTSYPDSSDDRSDTLLKAGLGMGRALGQRWYLSADYSFRSNSSTLEEATYSRHSLSVLMSYAL
ncbi:MAG: hypothetical protein IT285_12610 [Bdellovibrionales bacterium]|nr:hypothetical protein [Bdellovibrionales bacterium]